MFTPLDVMKELQMDAEAVMDREYVFIREPEKCNEWRTMIQRGNETKEFPLCQHTRRRTKQRTDLLPHPDRL